MKSTSGASVCSDEDDDDFGNLYMDHLNALTNERVLLSQKKLFKNVEPPSRKISVQDDDLHKGINVNMAQRKKSMFIKLDSFGRGSLDSAEPGHLSKNSIK